MTSSTDFHTQPEQAVGRRKRGSFCRGRPGPSCEAKPRSGSQLGKAALAFRVAFPALLVCLISAPGSRSPRHRHLFLNAKTLRSLFILITDFYSEKIHIFKHKCKSHANCSEIYTDAVELIAPEGVGGAPPTPKGPILATPGSAAALRTFRLSQTKKCKEDLQGLGDPTPPNERHAAGERRPSKRADLHSVQAGKTRHPPRPPAPTRPHLLSASFNHIFALHFHIQRGNLKKGRFT